MNAFGIVDSIGWTLIHFSWQGALVGGQTALALTLLRKARPFLGDAPVMFISGYAESDFSDLLQDETGVSFLPKPLDIKTLAERVKQELHSEA
mgnify:CR=1 FL=1